MTSLAKQSLDAPDEATKLLAVRVHEMGVGVGGRRSRFGTDYRPNGLRRHDGSLWFVATGGVVVVPPEGPYHHPLPPLVHIEDVRVDGQSLGTNPAIEILSGARHVDFHYTANTFAAPERAQFRYRFEGFDDGWIDAGGQRAASYTDLSPGEYQFRVIADNGHGVWNEAGASIRIVVQPRWFETVWFRLASVIGVLGLFVLAVHHRYASLKKRNLALSREVEERKQAEQSLLSSQERLHYLTGRLLTIQEEEDRRIARELHDDISQRLSALTLDTGAIARELNCSPNLDTTAFEALQQKIIDIAADVHNISRRLHPQILEDLGLAKAVRTECKAVSQLEGLEVELVCDSQIDELPIEKALCCYRVVQEALRNIAKHAQTKRATVRISRDQDEILVSIADNGVGFQTRSVHRLGGIGLTSMQERVQLCHGQLSIQSAVGKGTTVAVRMSLQHKTNDNPGEEIDSEREDSK